MSKTDKKYTIQITYSWGDEEPDYGTFDSEEEAYKTACEMAGREAYIANEEFDEDRTISVYFDAANKRIDLCYDWDQTECYYRVKIKGENDEFKIAEEENEIQPD